MGLCENVGFMYACTEYSIRIDVFYLGQIVGWIVYPYLAG